MGAVHANGAAPDQGSSIRSGDQSSGEHAGTALFGKRSFETHRDPVADRAREAVLQREAVRVVPLADGYQLAPPREIGDGAATTWPTLWTDVIPELGGHLFVTAAGNELTVVATSGVYDIVCGELAATDEPR